MQISSAYKQRLAKAARIASAGALVVSSVGTAVASPTFAQLTSSSTSVSTSAPSATSTLTIHFKPDAGKLNGVGFVSVDFCTVAGSATDSCTGAGVAGIVAGNVTTTGFANGTPTAATTSNGISLTFGATTNPEVAATDHVITIPGATNPSSTGTYYTRIKTYNDTTGTTLYDYGESAFAIVNAVDVSGRVLENLSFSVVGESSITATNPCSADASGVAVTAANTNTTATAVKFGNMAAGTPNAVCQSVATTTNAASGFSTYVHLVRAATGTSSAAVGYMCRQTATNCGANGWADVAANSDVIQDSGFPGAWTNGTTKGLGVNANGAESVTDFNAPTAKNFKSMGGTSGVQIATKASPSNGVKTYVAYKVDVPGTQTAGIYQTQFEYITTPIF